jgi:hypothetical protein
MFACKTQRGLHASKSAVGRGMDLRECPRLRAMHDVQRLASIDWELPSPEHAKSGAGMVPSVDRSTLGF